MATNVKNVFLGQGQATNAGLKKSSTPVLGTMGGKAELFLPLTLRQTVTLRPRIQCCRLVSAASWRMGPS